jgi:hypothetical protein
MIIPRPSHMHDEQFTATGCLQSNFDHDNTC